MKRILIAITMAGPLFCQQPSTILSNGWLGGLTVPTSCSSGTSPAFYRYGDQSIWDCIGNKYVLRGSGSTGTSFPVAPSPRTGIYDAFRVSVGNFPIANEAQGYATSAITGAVVASSTDDQAAGLAGYASTAYSSAYAVGIYTNVTTSAANTYVWGGNLTASNQSSVNCHVSGCGMVGTNVIGLEIDVNNFDNGLGAGAAGITGIQINSGYSTIQPPIGHAIEIAPLGPTVSWPQGIIFDTMATSTAAIEFLPTNNGPGYASQQIRFWSNDMGGNIRQATIGSDLQGNLRLQGGSGEAVQLVAGDGSVQVSAIPGETLITTNLTLGSSAPLTVPSIQSTSGQRYVCVTTTGQIVSSASACSGT